MEVLVSGSDYGEISLYKDLRLLHYVHAEDFSIIRKLRRSDFERIQANYGDLNDIIKQRAALVEAEYNE